MADRWTVTSRVDKGAGYVTFGPMDDALPAAFTATVDYAHLPVTVTLHLLFDGKRVNVDTLTLTGKDGHFITPRDTTRLELGAVVEDATEAAVQPGHGAHVGKRHGRRATPEELRLVAAVYWFRHVAGGDPRKAVMGYWGLPPATASRWLRRARELYDMPEVD